MRPSKENLKAVAEFTLPWTYTEIWAFLGLVGHCWQFIKGYVCIGQPLHEHLSREGTSKNSEQVTLMAEAKDAFETHEKTCLEAYASWSLTIHEHNYHSTKHKFLTLKVGNCRAVSGIPTLETVHYQNWQQSSYIMTASSLDATWHQWVESLARFTFSIEYQKGQDSEAADALSQVTSKLDAKTVKSIPDVVTIGMSERADAKDLVVTKADEEIHKDIQETGILARATQTHINLHVTDWVTAQQEDQILKTVIECISNQKVQDLKYLLGDKANTEEGKNHPSRAEEASILPRRSLPLPHTN